MTKLKQLKDQFPTATAEKKPKGDNVTFTTVLPRSVVKQLKSMQPRPKQRLGLKYSRAWFKRVIRSTNQSW